MGRFADVVERWGGRVVGVDLSLAVEAANANLQTRESVRILQADLFRLPFRQEAFDIVYSLGVLHHTPDCEKAFRQIAPLVSPGGRLCIWVYGYLGLWERFARIYRRVTTRMPHRLLHALCFLAIPWYYACRLPGIGKWLFTLVPISMHPNPAWRVLDTFDWYSPQYQSCMPFRRCTTLVVISYHSLEDRLVKHAFRDWAARCLCPPGRPICDCGWTPKVRFVFRGRRAASDAEIKANPRARSAGLRAMERLAS